jgi:hypothetical protein
MLGRMTTYYAILTRNMGALTIKSGKYVDDAIIDTTSYLSAGGMLIASTDALVAAAAAIATAMWKKGKGATECDALMLAAYQASIAAYENAHDTVVSAGYAAFYHPLADELVSVVNDFQMVTGACAIAVKPKLPTKLQVHITDAANAVSGTCALVGVGADGSALSQTINLHGGTRTIVTDDAYAVLTSATLTVTAGAGGGKNIGIGCKGELGLPVPKGATNVVVNKAVVDHADEAVGTVDATARTIVPTTGCNGTHDYEFWYSYHLAATST